MKSCTYQLEIACEECTDRPSSSKNMGRHLRVCFLNVPSSLFGCLTKSMFSFFQGVVVSIK